MKKPLSKLVSFALTVFILLSALPDAAGVYADGSRHIGRVAAQLGGNKDELRVISAVDTLGYAYAGFAVSGGEKETEVKDTHVYESIYCNGEQLTSVDLSVGGGYLTVLIITGVPDGACLTVTPFAIKQDGTRLYGEAVTFTVTNGELTAKTDTFTADKYGTCYEIFVYSFCDSDGDGIGDINGVTQKLDYIEDLGCDSIWLMPVMPSPTYHKYDVSDYERIDGQYGTVADFRNMVAQCHKRGIGVVIDLVVNHTSTQHYWFKEASEYLKTLDKEAQPDPSVCPYVEYYNFKNSSENGYANIANTPWYYEARFWSEMPDLNLNNESVRREIEEITQFWIDLGVDGFRLDAVTSYVTGDLNGNVSILSWFTEMTRSQKSDIYTVGEAWEDYNTYAKYYQSGADSFFDFAFANSGGVIEQTVNGRAPSGASYYGSMQKTVGDSILAYADEYVNAPFLSNHDMNRAATFFTGTDAAQKLKLAHAMTLTMSGRAYIYYGDELGMYGSGKDENKRLAMQWQNGEYQGKCKGPDGADSVNMPYGSLNDQQNDASSVYNYVKKAVGIRNKYPAVCRGETQFLQSLSDNDICVMKKTYRDETVYIVYNVSNSQRLVNLNIQGLSVTDELTAGGASASLNGSTLSIPAYGVVLLK